MAIVAIAVPATLWIISWSSPVTYAKIVAILTKGVADYQSIQSRSLLWEESWRLGIENPWVGIGAGAHVLGASHSHNLILDYFRGVGAFGALAMLLLLITVIVRAATFYKATLSKGGQGKWCDTIIVALYLGALGYMIGNQLSDSLSPSTAFGFWVVYVAAYLSAEAVARSSRSNRRRRSRPLIARAMIPRTGT